MLLLVFSKFRLYYASSEMFGFLKNIGPVEWTVLGLIAVALFGSKIVKTLGKTSGSTYKEIKNIKKTFTEALEDGDDKEEGENQEEK